MYNIYRLTKEDGKDKQIDTGVGYTDERSSFGSAINMVATELESYQYTGKKGKIDCVFYDGMSVIRLATAKGQLIYRLAIIKKD